MKKEDLAAINQQFNQMEAVSFSEFQRLCGWGGGEGSLLESLEVLCTAGFVVAAVTIIVDSVVQVIKQSLWQRVSADGGGGGGGH